MHAFGPYRDTEVIDFNDLKGQQLFAISGNTGAGKTTIFDGISFALYGNASGEDRENQAMLRSQFADDSVHTAVELLFSLKGRTYRILRQLGHVKKGNKTKTGERYEFYEIIDGDEFPCVDRQIVSEINAKVESLLGLTQDQFKQIVMLPQGEFRKLLTSETENKEAILRRLFKTEPYKQIGEKLRIRKKTAEENFQRQKDTLNHYIQHVYATLPEREESMLFQLLNEGNYNTNQVLISLEKEISFYEKQMVEDATIYKQLEIQHKQASEKFYAAKALNERFEELAEKEAKWEQLQAQEEVFQAKEKELRLSEHATQIKPYEQQMINQKQEVQVKLRLLEKAKQEMQQGKAFLEQAEKAYKEQENKQVERENITRKVNSLEEFLPTVKELDQIKRNIQSLKERALQTEKQVNQGKEVMTKNEKNIQELREKIKQMDEKLSSWPEKEKQRNELRVQVKLMQKYKENLDKQTTLEQQGKTTKQAYLKAKETYEQIENAFILNQASVLASQLHDGDACPVCGSTHHPQKASHAEAEISKEQVETSKQELERKENAYRNVVADWKSNHKILEEQKQEMVEFDVNIADISNDIQLRIDEGIKLTNELKQFEAISKQVKQLKVAEEKESNLMKEAEEKQEKLKKTYQEEQMNYSNALATYKERIRVIPEDVRILEALEKQIAEVQNKKLTLEKAWEEAQRELQTRKENMTKISANLNHANKQVEEVKEKFDQAETAFHAALTKGDFLTEDAYHKAKRAEEEQLQLKQAIEQYKEQVITVSKRVEELKRDLQGKERKDLPALEGLVNELKENYEKAFKIWNDSKAYYQDAKKLLENIQASQKQVEKQEKEYSIVSDLHDLIRGQNDHKISFERFLQIEYLEQIIDAANERLRHLSNGQFMLMRSDRQESHGRQSGLALDVYDAYTGQNRDVKTLSGGEKFNASLCLALGMSDVIQSFQGNISINTMFIDEGFGSLDEESLHKAIDTLVELQESGRMIGVISHVKELKTIFPAVLEVKKTKEGYSKTKFVVK